ncbi:hypothetical protein HDV04_000201 [Boothiomyces sp. JEL0838]|nr:hypothetical protein HDV04_000201 [Boothiomyces sp. JEL0838]
MKPLKIKIKINKELPELNAIPRCLLLEYGILCKVIIQNSITILEINCLENDLEFTKKVIIKELKKRLPGFKLPIEWNISENPTGNWDDAHLLANLNNEASQKPFDLKDLHPESSLNPQREMIKVLDKPILIQATNVQLESKNIDPCGKLENLSIDAHPKAVDHKDDVFDTIGRNDLTLLDDLETQTDNQKVVFVSYKGRGISIEISKYNTLKKLYIAIQKDFPMELKINTLFWLIGNEKFYITGINDFKPDQIYYVEADDNAHFEDMEGFYNRLFKFLTKEEIARIYHLFEQESIHFETLKMLDAQKLNDMGINQIGLQDLMLYMNESKGIGRCKGYGELNLELIEREWLKQYDEGLPTKEINASIKKYIISNIDGISCPFETHQMRILILIFQQVQIDSCYMFLLRFAAASGHPKLLSLLFQLTNANKDSPVEWPDTIKTKQFITLNYHDEVKELFYQSLYTGKIVYSFQIMNSNLPSQLVTRDWGDMLHACVKPNSVALLHIFMEKHSHTRPFQVQSAIKLAAVPYFGQKKKRINAFRILETLPDNLLNEDSDRIILMAAESGQDNILRYMHSKGQQFNFLQGAPLFNATMFGRVSTVKLLLYDIRVNSYIFHKERGIVICLLTFDHLLILYALVTGFISLINGWVCSALGLGDSTFSVFGFINDSTKWCIDPSLSTDTSGNNLFIFLFFSVVYSLFHLYIPFVPMLRSVYMVLRKNRIDRIVNPNPAAIV